MRHEVNHMTSNFRLGLFLLISLAVVSVGTFLIGRQSFDFTPRYRLRTEFKTVAGLNAGADVRVGGIHKGTVRAIKLPSTPQGRVEVTMELTKDTRQIVKRDSVASIQSEGLLGDKYVEVSFGSPGAGDIKGGETIDSAEPFDVSDLFQKANKLLDSSQGALNGVQATAENLTKITGKINQGQGTAGKLINDDTLYKQAAASVTSLHDDAEALKQNFFLRGFFKERGYSNPDDLKKHEIAQLPAAAPQENFKFDAANLFDKADSAKMKNQKLLNPAGQYLQAHPFQSAVIVTSSGMKGDSDQVRMLTEARSFVVRKYLVENFKLDDTRVRTLGLGKKETTAGEGIVELLIYESDGNTSKETARK
jgi:phospholipid/cholesterol/gamma-HCH transport system substrate-binding protein